MSSHGSHAKPEQPAVDERLVAPGCGYEIDDGKLVRVPPADPPHAEQNARLAALLEVHTADDFKVAIDMLTRTSPIDDIAPDASVFPASRDPRTGGRQLEHIAFEVVSTQSLADAGRKAAKLVGRGVRRVFAIDVERVRAFEWSTDLGTWSLLGSDALIDDRVFAVPLPIAAVLREARVDDAVATALLAKGNPVLAEALARTRAEAVASAVIQLLVARGIEVSAEQRASILAERDPARLDRWLARTTSAANAAEVLAPE